MGVNVYQHIMQKIPVYLLLLCFLALAIASPAQSGAQQKRLKVALFVPLYLDSAFDETSMYRHGISFPKYIKAGLEFYEGAQTAADSLAQEGVPLDVYVYDTRSDESSVTQIINNKNPDSVDLIIGQVNGTEARQLATAAASMNIPFINANYPNDAGITNNPDFVILNSTLYTHCAGIYRFIQKNYQLAPVVMFQKKGAQEDRLKGYFESISKSTSSVPLKVKYVTLEDGFTAEDIKAALDEDVHTVVVAGSVDLSFANNLMANLSSISASNPVVLFAMPTWWDATNFARPEYKGVEVFYSTPFYVSPVQPFAAGLTNAFRVKYYSRPTDMFFRGYETLYHFAHLLQLHGNNLNSSLSDKRFKVFTDFDIQPIIDPKTNTLNYFENKKLYFVKKVDGVVTVVY
jgi:hypothetical protein